jgi:hypothetical protein
MHHPASQKRGCECRNSTDPDAANIVSLLGPMAVLVTASASLMPPALAKSPDHHITSFISFVRVPDGPPPRA